MAINWFPGHMKKTQREIKENLKLVDVVIEVRDARIPSSSANPDIEKLVEEKPRLILLNKSDLTEKKITSEWIKSLSLTNVKVLEVNCLSGMGLNAIKPAMLELLKEKHDRQKKKGLVNVTMRAMVVGIPNCGKSTFINKMARKSIAKTGDRPGVTKNKQWIKTSIGIELLDTPGVLWPKFADDETALNLAFTGGIKDEIMDIEELALKLVKRLQTFYPERLMERYKLEEIFEEPIDILNAIAIKRGCIMRGNEIDYTRIAVLLLDEFRGGKIGNITLERPKKEEKAEEKVEEKKEEKEEIVEGKEEEYKVEEVEEVEENKEEIVTEDKEEN